MKAAAAAAAVAAVAPHHTRTRTRTKTRTRSSTGDRGGLAAKQTHLSFYQHESSTNHK